MMAYFQNVVAIVKRFLFAKTGEPYLFGNRVLRFFPGTRPVRTKYRDSPNANVRNDARQVEFILQNLRDGDSAVDIGAHAGEYGVLMSACCGPKGQVVCFEPDPDAISQLERNFSLNPDLKPAQIVQSACSDANGAAIFFTQGGNSQSSLAKSALPAHRATKEISVPTIRLDDWWSSEHSAMPRLVKIDTEGAEVHVLRGMPNILASDARIVCELHPFAWGEFKVTFDDIEKVVRDAGRTMVWLDGRGTVSSPGEYGTVVLSKL